LEATYGPEVVTRGGLRVTTTLDPDLQAAAEQAARDGLVKQTIVLDDRTRVRIDARFGKAKVSHLDDEKIAKVMGGKARALRPDSSGELLRVIGIMNADESYIGASLSWNLFDGFSDEHTIEAARYKKLSAAMSLADYKNRVKTELDNAFLQLAALKSRLLSAKMEVKAQEAYYRLTEGRFENQLASADELSRSIADLAAARAKVSALKSQIFSQKAAILLMSGLKSFQRRFHKTMK